MTDLAFLNVLSWMASFCVDTSHRTPSLHGGVVSEPSYL